MFDFSPETTSEPFALFDGLASAAAPVPCYKMLHFDQTSSKFLLKSFKYLTILHFFQT
jgi:hypothetical protein